MRGQVKTKREYQPDIAYDSILISKFINHLMKDGKKSVAAKVMYDAMDDIKAKQKKDPLEIFDKAIENASPAVEVRSRRVGGANYQVPREVKQDRRVTLAIRWLIDSARSKKGKPMRISLSDEIVLASKGEGDAIKKKENVYKMAEANRAFAHFAW